MAVRCSAIGQSNSILRTGFLSRLLASGVVKLEKSVRIGASPSIIAPFFAKDDFFEGSRFCIVDLCVIDIVSAHFGTTAEQVHEWLNWIGHVARQNGCQPIFVLIPRNTDEEQKAILSVYEKLIRENSFLFIDVRTVARSLTGDDFGLAALYQDRSHPGELLSNAVADILAKFIANPDSFRYTKREVSALTKQFKTIAAANSESEHEIVSYKTSLMSMDCVRLRRGQTLQVRTGKFEKLQGISVNAAQCHQKVTLHGATEVVKDMSLRPFTKNPFEARVLPVDLPLRDLDGYVALSIAPADASVDDTSMETVPVSSTGPDHVEVGDLLLETGSRPMLYLAALPDMGTTDLVELVKLIQ